MSMMISAGRRLCGRDDGATPVLSVMTSKSAIRSADVSAFPRILVLVDTRHGVPQADAVANSDVVEEKLIGGSRPNVACLPSKNIIHSAKLKTSRRASTFGFENRVDLWIRPAAQERIERVPSENVYLDAPSGQY